MSRQKSMSRRRQRPPTQSTRRRKKTNNESALHFFLFALGVFLILCGLSLLGHMVVEEPAAREPISFNIGEPRSFFEAMAPAAQKSAPKYGLYPSVALAQAALESEYGKSRLSFDYHNYFGIKAHDGIRSVHLKTTEYVNGNKITISDGFCVYQNPYESFEDYAHLLGTSKTYTKVREATSPAEAARAIQASGYATDPYYANKIISLINQYNLSKYDPLEKEATTESTEGEGH